MINNTLLVAEHFATDGEPIVHVLDCPQIPDEEYHPIYENRWKQQSKRWRWESQPAWITYQQNGQAGGEAMIDILTSICNKIWKTGDWPTTWPQSLVKATCSCARTTASSALSAILVRSCWRSSKTDSSHKQKRSLQKSKQVSELEGAPQNKYSISGSSMRKYLPHQQNLYHVFIDFKQAFDRVWHEALWTNIAVFSEKRDVPHLQNQSMVAISVMKLWPWKLVQGHQNLTSYWSCPIYIGLQIW